MKHAREFATPAADVPVPLACLEDYYALITQEASGITLARLLRQLCLVRTQPATAGALCAAARRPMAREFQAGVPPVGE